MSKVDRDAYSLDSPLRLHRSILGSGVRQPGKTFLLPSVLQIQAASLIATLYRRAYPASIYHPSTVDVAFFPPHFGPGP